MTKAVIAFFISLAVYLVVMGIITLVKFLVHKHRVKKQKEEYEKEQVENEQEK